jgi:WD40 repeat protein
LGALRRPLYFCDDLASSQVESVAVFPDGRRVVSASNDNTLKVWDVATGQCVATLEGHSKAVRRAESIVLL